MAPLSCLVVTDFNNVHRYKRLYYKEGPAVSCDRVIHAAADFSDLPLRAEIVASVWTPQTPQLDFQIPVTHWDESLLDLLGDSEEDLNDSNSSFLVVMFSEVLEKHSTITRDYWQNAFQVSDHIADFQETSDTTELAQLQTEFIAKLNQDILCCPCAMCKIREIPFKNLPFVFESCPVFVMMHLV